MKIHLTVTPKMCGPVSFGTVELIKLLRANLGLSLGEAKRYVDQCVFDHESVEIPVPEGIVAEDVVHQIRGLVTPALIQADLKND